ncbi:unnamed protein product [Gongylonema pulchrum]|uniref:Secreted protein n=1 Tax=Gongylonema pulchrum TaxID=637853 RepID=A0A183ECF3_9BILA|nr:unnamed protein product [Gongylonema pulchrum]
MDLSAALNFSTSPLSLVMMGPETWYQYSMKYKMTLVCSYTSEEPDCNAFVSSWETVAHRLRGLVNVGKVDMSVNDDVTERFRLDDSQCPTFLL